MGQEVGVLATWQSKYQTRDPSRTFAEQVQQAALGVMRAGGLTPDDVDAFVFSLAPTFFMGIADADRWSIDYLFGAGKPIIRVHTGGATGGSAVHAAYHLVKSGQFRSVMVIGAERIAETPDAQTVLNLIFDPLYERDVPLAITTAGAMQILRYMHTYGVTQEDFARVVVRQRSNAIKNPYAHLKGEFTVDDIMNTPMIAYPVKLGDCSPRSTGSAAMIVGDESMVKQFQTRPAFINAIGSTTDTYWPGDRMAPTAGASWNDFELCAYAGRDAFHRAGIRDPLKEIQVAELYDGLSNVSYHMLEHLGFCEKGTAARLDRDGAWDVEGGILPVNPSGGVLCANPIAISALIRAIEAANQVMGTAGEIQIPNVHNAIATTAGGIGQFVNCTIFGDEPLQA